MATEVKEIVAAGHDAADHTQHAVPAEDPPVHSYQQGVPLGLSLLGGLGLTLAIAALALGVVQPAGTDVSWAGLLLVAGLLIFVSAFAAWFGAVRPDQHFDDINQPLYHGHADHAHDTAAHDTAAHDTAAHDAHH